MGICRAIFLVGAFGVYCSHANSIKPIKLKEVEYHRNERYRMWAESLFLRENSPSNVQIISAAVQDEVLFSHPGRDVLLNCHFVSSPRTQDPVRFTWKRGPRLATAYRIASVSVSHVRGILHYDNFVIFDRNYEERLAISQNADIGLRLKKFQVSDSGKYWCLVQNGQDFEYGTDAASVTLISAQSRRPEAYSQQFVMPMGVQGAIAGDTVVLKCGCISRRCDWVKWFKGPHNKWGNEFYDIANMVSNEISITSSKIFSKDGKKRISINDDFGLTIHGVTGSDAGRYWCEVTWVERYFPNRRHWESKSMVLLVNQV